MTVKKEKLDLRKISIGNCEKFPEILAEKLKRIGYSYNERQDVYSKYMKSHDYYTQDGKNNFSYKRIFSYFVGERVYEYKLIINGKNRVRRFTTAIFKEIEKEIKNNNPNLCVQTNEYLYSVDSEFYAEMIFQEIKKEEARCKKEEKKIKQKIELSRYNSEVDIQELFEEGLKSKNLYKYFPKRKEEYILKNPEKGKGKIRLQIFRLSLERNSSLNDEEMMYKKEYIDFIITIDNGIIFDNFLNFTKKDTFNGDKVKDVEKIKKIIEVINNHAEKIAKEESNLEKCNIKYLMFWKKYLFEDIKKILG